MATATKCTARGFPHALDLPKIEPKQWPLRPMPALSMSVRAPPPPRGDRDPEQVWIWGRFFFCTGHNL